MSPTCTMLGSPSLDGDVARSEVIHLTPSSSLKPPSIGLVSPLGTTTRDGTPSVLPWDFRASANLLAWRTKVRYSSALFPSFISLTFTFRGCSSGQDRPTTPALRQRAALSSLRYLSFSTPLASSQRLSNFPIPKVAIANHISDGDFKAALVGILRCLFEPQQPLKHIKSGLKFFLFFCWTE